MKLCKIGLPKLTSAGLAFSTSTVMLLALVFFWWAKPVHDDFCRAIVTLGPLDYALKSYMEWTGRWVAMALHAAVLARLPITSWGYPVALLVLATICVGTLHLIVRMAVTRLSESRRMWPITGVLVVLLWSGMPSPGEVVYWWTGSVEHLLTFSTAALSIIALSMMSRRDYSVWAGLPYLGISCLLIILATGMHEIGGAMLLVVLGSGTLIVFRSRSSWGWFWVVALSVCLVGVIVTSLAPGNGVRIQSELMEQGAQAEAYARQIMFIIAWQVRHLLIPWIFDVRLLLASVVLVTSSQFTLAPLTKSHSQPVLWRVLVPLATIACVAGGMIAPIISVRSVGPARLHDLVYAVFVLGCFGTILAWAPCKASDRHVPLVRSLNLFSTGLLSVALLMSPNAITAAEDLLGGENTIRWNALMEQRYAFIRSEIMEGRRDLSVANIKPIPSTYFQRDIGIDPDRWNNRCFAAYFKLQSIRVQSIDVKTSPP